jgi:cytochrome c peroxidase
MICAQGLSNLLIQILISVSVRLLAVPLIVFASFNSPDTHALSLGEPILPITPEDFSAKEREQIALGRELFNDRRLSRDNSTSCASCHSLDLAGADGKPVSVGIGGVMGSVNAPTVINSGLNFVQFWDGRAATLEEQAAGPVHNPIEMGSNWVEVLEKLQRDPGIRSRFVSLYNDGLTAENIVHAIAIFERSLLTVDAPFDRYLGGDDDAISEEAKQGYRLFKSYGCVACHQGKNVGGNMYARMGALGEYFLTREKVGKSDLGRFNVTAREDDRHVFKVPGLRLVTRTAPYFHDGSVATLEEAIRIMAQAQLGRRITEKDTALIIAFLETLAGKLHEVTP